MIEQRVPLRQRRDLRQIIEASLQLYGQSFSPLFLVAATVVPVGLAAAVFQSTGGGLAVNLIAVGIGALDVLVNILAAAALIAALNDLDSGQTPTFSRAYDVAFERAPEIFRAVLRVAFHVLLFAVTIVGIPWAILRSIRWLFIEQAIMLDGASAKESLSTSAAAVEGSWWRTLGIWLVILIVIAIPSGFINALFLLTPTLVAGTVSAFLNALALPFTTCAITMLYFDLKARKEPDDVVSSA